MKILLDTDILRFEESEPENETISNLFYWLQCLIKKTQCIVFVTQDVKIRNRDFFVKKIELETPKEQFSRTLLKVSITDKDREQDAMLFATYNNDVDVLITNDERTILNAKKLGIATKVKSINGFITEERNNNPTLINYKSLNVKKTTFSACNINDPFFTSFKNDYDGFTQWFSKKSNKEVYVCMGKNQNETTAYLGFLYLKIENEDENYDDIYPIFEKKKRLKIGTFKVESSGFRLGERFLQIIFDNAVINEVDEIYVTLFKGRPELNRLYELLKRWGFTECGVKESINGKSETVMIKKLKFDDSKSIQENFPTINKSHQKRFLPIAPEWHLQLMPDSEKQSDDILENIPSQYALEKVYITFSYSIQSVKPGDLIIVYRMGEGEKKGTSSMVTTVGVIKEAKFHFNNEEDFVKECQNRSVFKSEKLKEYWNTKDRKTLGVVKFFAIHSFFPCLNLCWLWKNKIIQFPNGPRPFDIISDESFNKIISQSILPPNIIRWSQGK